ncbi:MAG TPA: hypothetical protein VIV11_12150 [Kofleriaceae bacterium]
MTKHVLIAALLFACGKPAEPGADWSAKPLDATIESKVKGVPFKLSVPKNFKFDGVGDDKEDNPESITKRWRPDVKDYFSEPSVSVSYAAIPAKDLDGFVSDAMVDKDKDVIAKKEQTADGFVMLYHTKNKGIVRVELLKRKGDVHLNCRASQAKQGGVPSPDATMAWLEKMCASLTLL